MAQWQPPDYAVPVQKKWKPPPYVVSPPTQETRKPLEQELDEEYAKQVPSPEPQESGLGKIWRVANTPVTEYLPESLQGVRPNRLVSHVAEPLMKYGESAPVGKSGSVGGFVNELGRKAARYGGALAQSMGNVTDEMLNPINIGLTALTGGASMARSAAVRGAEEGASIASVRRLANLAKGLETPGRVAGGAMVAHGAYKGITGDTTEEKLGGGVEALIGGLGMRAGKFPKQLKMRNIEEVPVTPPQQRMLPLPRGNAPTEPAGPFNMRPPMDMSKVEELRKYMDDLNAGNIPRDSPLSVKEGEVLPPVVENDIFGIPKDRDLTDLEVADIKKRLDLELMSSYGEDTVEGQRAVDELNGIIDITPTKTTIEKPDLVPGTPLAKYQEYRRIEREAGRKPVTYLQWENRIDTSSDFDEPQFREVPEKPKQGLQYKTPEETFVETGDRAPEEIRPTATYNYFQPDEIAGGGFDQYDIQGGPYDRSTVGRDRLIEQGISIPPTPETGKMIPARVRGFLESAGISPQEIDSYTAQQAIGKMGELRNNGDIRDESGRSIAPAQPVPEAIQERPAGPWDTNAPPDKWIPPEYAVPSDEPQFQAKEFGNENIFKGSKGEGLGKEPFDKQWETSIEEAKKLGIDYKSYDNLDELQWDITKKAAQETIRTGKNPIGKTEEPEFMKVEGTKGKSELENIAMGGASERTLDVIGTSLYSKNRPNVVTKELLQNSFDEHRIAKQTTAIKVVLHHGLNHPVTGKPAHSITIMDEGRGLTPEQLYSKFTDVGETGKAEEESASGGFGFAKAAPMLGGNYFEAVSIVNEGGKKVAYTFRGDPKQIKKQKVGVELEREVIKSGSKYADTPTGLIATTYFPEDATMYYVADLVKDMTEGSSSITSSVKFIDVSGVSAKQYVDDWLLKPGTNNFVTKNYLKEYQKGPERPIQDTISTPGAQIDIRYDEPVKGTKAGQYKLVIQNKGLWQSQEKHGYGVSGEPLKNVPGEIIADIRATVEEGDDNYPFTANREQLEENVKNAIDKWIDENIVSGALKKRKKQIEDLYDSMQDFPGTTVARPGVLFDPGDRLTPDEVEFFRNSPIIQELILHTDVLIDNILNAVGKSAWTDRVEKVGMFLPEKFSLLGIHIPNNRTDKSTILINNFGHILFNLDNPRKAADEMVITGLHEVGHVGQEYQPHVEMKLSPDEINDPRVGEFMQSYLDQIAEQGDISPGHGVSWLKRTGLAFTKFGVRNSMGAADDILKTITDPNTGGYNAGVQELLRIYQESRGRAEITPDYLSGTGVERRFGGRGKKDIPSNAKPDGEGSPVAKETTKKGDRRKKSTGGKKVDATDAIGRLKVALEKGLLARKKQNLLYSAERSRRAAKISQVKTEGMAGHYERLGKLKGALPKVPFESGLKQTDLDTIADAIVDSDLTPYQKVSTVESIMDMFNGVTPQDKQIELIAQALGHDLGETIAKYGGLGMIPPVGQLTTNIINIPKSVMATLDMSAPLRQGLPLINKGAWWSAFAKMFKYYGSEKAFQEVQKFAQDRPKFALGENSGLFLADIGKHVRKAAKGEKSQTGELNRREEAFLSEWVDKVKFPPNFMLPESMKGRGIRPARASNRAYVGFLNKLRADVFDNLVDSAKTLGHDVGHLNEDGETVPSKVTLEIAKFVNNATGRGGLGKYGERIAVPLNAVLFSPRLITSRLSLLNPAFYINPKNSWFIKKQALQALLTVAGVGALVNTLSYLSGKGERTDEITSTDFGKIKFGNARFDYMGGFQQYVVAAARLISGKTTSTTGREYDLNQGKFPGPTRLSTMSNFVRSKESPIASFADAIASGSQSFPPSGIGARIGINQPSAEVINRFIPMIINDTYDLAQEEPWLLPLGIPSTFLGASSQVIQPPKGRNPFNMGVQQIRPPQAP